MGREIAWRRFPLTSATGAATVSQLQCRNTLMWEGLEFNFLKQTFKENEVLKKRLRARNEKAVILLVTPCVVGFGHFLHR